jgi:hypothetical protein
VFWLLGAYVFFLKHIFDIFQNVKKIETKNLRSTCPQSRLMANRRVMWCVYKKTKFGAKNKAFNMIIFVHFT